jgi:hypothetical protein
VVSARAPSLTLLVVLAGAACARAAAPDGSVPIPAQPRAIGSNAGPASSPTPRSSPPPSIEDAAPSCRFAISAFDVLPSTHRTREEQLAIARGTVLDRLRAESGVCVDLDAPSRAPMSATFSLSFRVDEIVYANGNLQVRVALSVYRHKPRGLAGAVAKTLTHQSTTARNRAREDELIAMAVDLAARNFAEHIGDFEVEEDAGP